MCVFKYILKVNFKIQNKNQDIEKILRINMLSCQLYHFCELYWKLPAWIPMHYNICNGPVHPLKLLMPASVHTFEKPEHLTLETAVLESHSTWQWLFCVKLLVCKPLRSSSVCFSNLMEPILIYSRTTTFLMEHSHWQCFRLFTHTCLKSIRYIDHQVFEEHVIWWYDPWNIFSSLAYNWLGCY